MIKVGNIFRFSVAFSTEISAETENFRLLVAKVIWRSTHCLRAETETESLKTNTETETHTETKTENFRSLVAKVIWRLTHCLRAHKKCNDEYDLAPLLVFLKKIWNLSFFRKLVKDNSFLTLFNYTYMRHKYFVFVLWMTEIETNFTPHPHPLSILILNLNVDSILDHLQIEYSGRCLIGSRLMVSIG